MARASLALQSVLHLCLALDDHEGAERTHEICANLGIHGAELEHTSYRFIQKHLMMNRASRIAAGPGRHPLLPAPPPQLSSPLQRTPGSSPGVAAPLQSLQNHGRHGLEFPRVDSRGSPGPQDASSSPTPGPVCAGDTQDTTFPRYENPGSRDKDSAIGEDSNHELPGTLLCGVDVLKLPEFIHEIAGGSTWPALVFGYYDGEQTLACNHAWDRTLPGLRAIGDAVLHGGCSTILGAVVQLAVDVPDHPKLLGALCGALFLPKQREEERELILLSGGRSHLATVRTVTDTSSQSLVVAIQLHMLPLLPPASNTGSTHPSHTGAGALSEMPHPVVKQAQRDIEVLKKQNPAWTKEVEALSEPELHAPTGPGP